MSDSWLEMLQTLVGKKLLSANKRIDEDGDDYYRLTFEDVGYCEWWGGLKKENENG